VTTTTVFTIIKQFYLNPGNSLLFPVFSKIAATYEEYICHMLRFWYRGEEYTASGTVVSAGILVYATNMDVDDSTFTNVDQMENYDDSESGPPFSGHFMHDVLEVHKKRGRNRGSGGAMPLNNYFVFSSANQEAPSGLSQIGKFYDLGNFQIASNGTQTASPAGELWVEHSWTMIRRKQETPLGQSLLGAHISESPVNTAAAAGSAFLGTSGGTVHSGSNLVVSPTGNTFLLPVVGNWLVAGFWAGSVTVVPTLTGGANIAVLNTSDGVVNNGLFSVAGNATSGYLTFIVSASGTGAANTVTITGLTNLAAGHADIFIQQISSGLTKPAALTIEQRFRALEDRFARLSSVAEVADSDFEEKTPASSCSSSSSLSLDRSLYLSRDAVRQLLKPC